MALLALGLNHQTAPIALREKVAFAPETLPEALRSLCAVPGVHEAALLSTCNRTELYARIEPRAEASVLRWLAEHHDLGVDTLEAYIYRHADAAAVRHLFRVSTGLDSLVLGEPQILGQVKQAWQTARSSHALKTGLDRLFQHCFAVAKRVRTDTRIGAHPVSVAYAAVRLAQQVFARLDQATVLLVGAGETIELAARHLVDAKARRILVANRTLDHAQQLAHRFGGVALPLDDLQRHLSEADIVICATASREPVLTRDAIARAIRARRHAPMFLLDLAVPRDIEPEAATLDDVYLYTVDDLEQVIGENRRSRQQAAGEAETLIDLQVEQFMAWWRGSTRQDTLISLRARSEATRDELLARAKEQLAAGRDPHDVLEHLAHGLTNKLLHAPTAGLRRAAHEGDAQLLSAAARLFDDASAHRADNPPANRKASSDDAEPSRKLEALAERREEVARLLAEPDALADHKRFRDLSREFAQLEPITRALTDYEKADAELASALSMRDDPEMRELANAEIPALQDRMSELDTALGLLLIPVDPRDDANLFLEVRAGTGGDEAAIFAGDLFRMYARYAERNRWKVEIESSSPGEHGGYREIVARVEGRGAFSRLKFESGTHRVQRVPETEAQGRIHTSAATVAILPDDDEVDEVVINPADLKVDTYRSSGAGGQHVNKTESAIRITHLPTGVVVENQTDRSQHANREKAMQRLKAMLLEAERTKAAAATAASRRLQVGSGDRSQRIRTYNFPQGRITDHRVEGLTLYRLPEILEGDLDDLVERLTREHQADELRLLTEAA